LTKIRAVPIFRAHRVAIVRTVAGRMRELVESADVVSEGATRTEDGSAVYYGSTSLLFRAEAIGVSPEDLKLVLERDPHVRLLALRVARREIAARVASDIGPLRAEVSVSLKGRCVTFDVDVVAAVALRRARG
jgi:hypothetical protein